ncbi:MAG: hypothetical protein ACK54T_11570 [bacterium]
MTIVRKMLLATGAAAALTGSASAQLFDSGLIGNFSGSSNAPLGTWAEANNLSTVVPAGNYSRWLVVAEWGNTNTTFRDQRSSHARVFLGLAPANGGVASSAPTNPVASQRITTSFTRATNSEATSSGSTTSNRVIVWTGTMLGTGIGNFTAPTTVFVGAGQTTTRPATSVNARWNNVRVIFNYNTFSTVAGAAVINPAVPFAPLAIPSRFTDLGTLGSAGRTSYTWSTSSNAPTAWFRFQLGSGLSGIPGGLLDMDTAAVTGQTQGDTSLTLFRVGSSGGLELLGPISQYVRSDSTTAPGVRFADDDSGPGRSSLLTFGDSNQTAPVGTTARDYGIAGVDPTVVFNGRNGDLAAGEYFVAVGSYDALITEFLSVRVTDTTFTDITGLGDYRLTTEGSVTTPTEIFSPASEFLSNQSFSLAFVPTPGAAALLGLGGLLAARRRRA